MELMSQVKELGQELNKVVQGEGSASAIVGLKVILDKLNPIHDSLKTSFDRRAVLYELPDSYRVKDNSAEEKGLLGSCTNSISRFEDTWSSLEAKYSIIQDDIYSETFSFLGELDSVLSTRNMNAYSEWLSQMDAEIRVTDNQLEGQLGIPTLKGNAEKYSEEFRKYEAIKAEKHINSRVIDGLRNRHQSLVKIKSNMVFDQPESVLRLFKHLGQMGNNSRAPISMLTPEVLKWMSDQGQDQYFYVADKRIGNSR